MNSFHRRFAWMVLLSAAVLSAWSGTPLVTPVAAAEEEDSSDAAGELKTIGVVSVTRYDKFIEDLNFLGSLAGKPEAGQMLEGGLMFVTQGKGANMLDKTQPWGLILQTDGNTLLAIGALPVKEEKDLLDVATNYGLQVKASENGVNELVMPNQQSYFVRHENGWAFLSNSAQSLSNVPAKPQAILGDLVKEYDIAARINAREVPEAWRQLAVAYMQMGMQQGMQQRDDETDEQFNARRELAEAQLQQVQQMINEIDAVTVGWAVDKAQQRTFVDFTYTFVPGTKMAKQIATYGDQQTNFAGFYQPDAAVTTTFATKADPAEIQKDIAQFETMMDNARTQIAKEIDKAEELAGEDEAREALKAAANDMLDAFSATIKEGQMDGGASLHLGADSLTLVAGALIKDTAKVESALKKLETASQNREKPVLGKIEWNADEHAGVKFHTLTVPIPADEEGPRKALGEEANVAIGIGKEAVYLAVGRDNLKAVKEAIDASASAGGKEVPPFELVASLGPILEFAAAQAEEGEQREVTQAVAQMLRNEAPGRDHVRMVGQVVPNGLRYRFEAEEGALRAIGKAAEETQRRRAQANQ